MLQSFLNTLLRLVYPAKHPSFLKKEYYLPDTLNLRFKLMPDGWFVVTSPELPGFVTQARSHEELIDMVNDAVLTYFDVPKKEGDVVYNQLQLGDTVIEYKGQLATKAA